MLQHKIKNKARAYNETLGISYGWKSFTLTKNSPAPVTVTYGDTLAKGSYSVDYEHSSKGGFKSTSILSKTY